MKHKRSSLLEGSLHEECVGCYNFQCGYIIRPDYCKMECVTYSYTDKTGKDHFNRQLRIRCEGQNWKLRNLSYISDLNKSVVIIQ